MNADRLTTDEHIALSVPNDDHPTPLRRLGSYLASALVLAISVIAVLGAGEAVAQLVSPHRHIACLKVGR